MQGLTLPCLDPCIQCCMKHFGRIEENLELCSTVRVDYRDILSFQQALTASSFQPSQILQTIQLALHRMRITKFCKGSLRSLKFHDYLIPRRQCLYAQCFQCSHKNLQNWRHQWRKTLLLCPGKLFSHCH